MDSQFHAFSDKAKIDLTLNDMDVPTVLRIIAKEGGKNIVLDESVKGIINAELKNISLNEAMQTILVSQELEARVDNDTIFVASRPAMAKKGLNRKYIKAFKLNNANAVNIAQILEASIFNKGYQVNDKAAAPSGGKTGFAFDSIANPAIPNYYPTNQQSQAPYQPQAGSQLQNMTTTGQSNLIDAKTIRGKVEELEPESGFGDSSVLAARSKFNITKQQPRI